MLKFRNEACVPEPAKLVLSLRAQRGFLCHCERSAAISHFLSLRACEAISLLAVCPPRTSEIASSLAMTSKDERSAAISHFLSLRAQRGNLSFSCLLALETRDRHVPRDDKPRRACEAISHFLSLRAQRGNLSFSCLPAPKPEIATFLAMTGKDEPAKQFLTSCHCERSAAISLFVSARTERRDRHVPRDDKQRQAQRGNLAFSCLSAPNIRDRHVPRDDRQRRACEAISL